ncbi:MAG: helix-turn-helix domain-containing protein [Acidobacteriia bacterium]|nr:helix-turn-helix domain-containing protein [Terriglobia bacterium]
MPQRRNSDDVEIKASSGNVFADLGFKDAEERQTKVKLAVALNRILAAMKLSQVKAAERLGVNQPKVSALKNYKLDGFSVERLLGFVTALNCDVEIVIRPRRVRKAGRITVNAA